MTDPLVLREIVAVEPTIALAGLLDIDPPEDGCVPPLWHWVYLLERRATRDLGPDGHPTTGIPAPPGPGRRRMFAGGRVHTIEPLQIGVPATRTTRVAKTVNKEGRSGPLTFVTVQHEIVQDEKLMIREEQDIVYRAAGTGTLPEAPHTDLPHGRECALELLVDEPLLFRFSALTYNAHRIHYDLSWVAREGYPGLLVHGPLQALMMGELARRNGLSLVGGQFSYRLVSPMVGPQPVFVYAAEGGLRAGAEVRAGDGYVTAVSTFA